MTAAPIPCRWCGRASRTRRGGSPRVFCTSSCRTAFHSAARRWAECAVASGLLTVGELRRGDPAACTLLSGGISHGEVSEHRSSATVALAAPPDERLLDLLGDILDELSVEELAVLPEAVWALIDYIADPEAEADAGGV
jgi:hypothetical protein